MLTQYLCVFTERCFYFADVLSHCHESFNCVFRQSFYHYQFQCHFTVGFDGFGLELLEAVFYCFQSLFFHTENIAKYLAHWPVLLYHKVGYAAGIKWFACYGFSGRRSRIWARVVCTPATSCLTPASSCFTSATSCFTPATSCFTSASC